MGDHKVLWSLCPRVYTAALGDLARLGSMRLSWCRYETTRTDDE